MNIYYGLSMYTLSSLVRDDKCPNLSPGPLDKVYIDGPFDRVYIDGP